MITVLLFAGLKERAGQDRILIDAPAMTVEALKAHIIKEIKGITHLEGALVAVNETYAEEHQRISENDTVAIIPPVSGG